MQRLHDEADAVLNFGIAWARGIFFHDGVNADPAERRGYNRYHDSHSIGLSVLESVEEGVRVIYDWPHQELKTRLVPTGGQARGIDSVEPSWLYSTHLLADSDTGDLQRLEKVRSHQMATTSTTGCWHGLALTQPRSTPSQTFRIPILPAPSNGYPCVHWTWSVRLFNCATTTRADETSAQRITERIADLDKSRREEGNGLLATQMLATQESEFLAQSPPETAESSRQQPRWWQFGRR